MRGILRSGNDLHLESQEWENCKLGIILMIGQSNSHRIRACAGLVIVNSFFCASWYMIEAAVTMLRCASKLLTTPLRSASFRPCIGRHFSESASSQSDDIDVTVSRGNKQAIALLRRVALAMESGKSWRTSVDKKALVVPKTAEFSVELETEGNENCLELQFKWISEPPKSRAKKADQ